MSIYQNNAVVDKKLKLCTINSYTIQLIVFLFEAKYNVYMSDR
jgi:hypothetical protein